MRLLKYIAGLGMAVAALTVAAPSYAQTDAKKLKPEYRFVMTPILAQAWFDIVHDAAQKSADDLGKQFGTKITIDYQAPAQADLVEQKACSSARSRQSRTESRSTPLTSRPACRSSRRRRAAAFPWCCSSPRRRKGRRSPYISNNFYDQGRILGEELLKRLNNKGKIAIIHGVPTNSAHANRFTALNELFKKYPDVQIVETAFDYDDVQKAQTEASRILAAHPDLDGFAVVDAAGPVGVGLAVQEAGKVGKVKFVGLDDVPQLQELMRAGVLDLSIATRPRMMGNWTTISLLFQNLGIESPTWFNTGIGYMTPDMVKNGNINGF
jgi:ribose transport system substrate-binding protein